MRTLPFFGRGLSWIPRINTATGGFVVSEGIDNAESVGLTYMTERWSIREDTGQPNNHIAESIAHILLTSPGEHDTLPQFGSRLSEAIFEPNTEEFRLVFGLYLQTSTERWEKRAKVPRSGVVWKPAPYLTDQGRLPLHVDVQFTAQQTEGNLVAPFVTPRDARSQEYKPIQFDSFGHDYYSRYYNRPSYETDGIRALKFNSVKTLEPQADDIFYRIKHKDTWLLISWELYRDIRFWFVIATMYVQDAAKSGASRKTMNITDVPEVGTTLRLPSNIRLLTEFTTYE